jgi:DNA-binding transcriptional MerR regulator
MIQEKRYTIQQAAEQTGLTSYTLRYYEDIGLMEPIARAPNGHRRYSEADMARIIMLLRLRKTNMSLDDMKYFISLYREGSATATERRELLEAHRQVVEAQIEELCEIRRFIDYKIGLYTEEEKLNYEQHEVSSVG